MKRRKELFLITLIALFVLSSVISINLNSDLKSDDKNIQNDEINELDELRGPNKSWFNNSMDPILIDNKGSNNWTWARTQDWCRLGNGSRDNPYIIENITIDGGGSGNGIFIKNSKNVYFEINNCTVYNSGSGIYLYNTNNGTIINNNCSLNQYSIFLDQCINNTISGNTVNNNTISGIFLYRNNYNNTISGNTVSNNKFGICLDFRQNNNNTISGNTVNNNTYGITIFYSNNNTVSGNTANYNVYGIYLLFSNNNTISANTLVGNVFFIEDDGGIGNTIEDNNRCYTKILPSGIHELKIEPYGVNDIDVNLTIALDNETEVLFSAFNENTIEDAPLNDGIIFMNLKLNDSNNLNQTIDAPINITLKYDFNKYEKIGALWFNESANGDQRAWEEIPFIDLGNGKIVISLNHTSIFALIGKIKSFPSSSSNGDDGVEDTTILLFIILAVLVCSLTIITASSTYYYKTRIQTRDKLAKKEALMKEPLAKSFDKKIDKSQNLKDYVEIKNLLRILKEKDALENLDLFDDLNLNFIPNELWEKIAVFEHDDKEKAEFIKYMLSITNEEKQEVIDEMLKLRESNSDNPNQQEYVQ